VNDHCPFGACAAIGVWSFSKFLEMVELFVQEENYGDCKGLNYAGGKEGYTCL